MGGSLPHLVLLVSVLAVRSSDMSLFERRVLRLVALGCNRRQIAALVDQPIDAVRQCQVELKQKTGAATLRRLARWARRQRLVLPDDRLTALERARLERSRGGKSFVLVNARTRRRRDAKKN